MLSDGLETSLMVFFVVGMVVMGAITFKGNSKERGINVIVGAMGVVLFFVLSITIEPINKVVITDLQKDRLYNKEIVVEEEYEDKYGSIYIDGYELKRDAKINKDSKLKGKYQEIRYTLKDEYSDRIYKDERNEYILYK